jgi:PTH1 family peptidyl-tRNA hydrolase
MDKENIPIENVLVITDDLNISFGTIRVKPKGSDGGHNGLKSIQETLSRTDYARLRFGIGSEFNKGNQVNYVLSPWSSEENAALPELLQKCADAVKSFATVDMGFTMSNFNNK